MTPELLAMLTDRERGMLVGCDRAQEPATWMWNDLPITLETIATLRAENAELCARLTTGIGLPLGVNDRDGNPVHVGDTLAFDGREWTRTYGAPDHIYTVEYSGGQVLVDGTIGDIRHYCRVVKRWDEKAADDAVKESP